MADFIPHVANLSERQKIPPLPFATIPFPRDRDVDRYFDRGDIPDCSNKRCSESAARMPCAVWGKSHGLSCMLVRLARQMDDDCRQHWGLRCSTTVR